MTMLQHGVVPSSGGYNIERSLRFNSADSAYLNRTPGSASNRRTWTWSGWVKRSALGTNGIFQGYFNSTNLTALSFNSTDTLFLQDYSGASFNLLWETPAVFRDLSAWYHIVFAFDTTQASSANAVKLYVNGIQQTLTFTAVSGSYTQNREGFVNNTNTQEFGKYSSGNYFNGYLADVHLIDGSALTPSSFGEFDTDTGVWKPKAYSGSYGTNGFKLTFSDNSNTTAATLGKDTSGNGNNWTPNNFSVTAGAGNDSLVDTPTQYGTDTGAGGEVRGNYATANPLKTPSSATLSNGNISINHNSNGGEQPATFAVSSGKWYWEASPNSSFGAYGIILTSATPSASSFASGYHYYGSNGLFYTATSGVSYGATFTSGDVIGVALNLDANEITFYKNGVSQGVKSISSGEYNPDFAAANTNRTEVNFGQRPFAYTAPSGFKALCTTNLPTPAIGATSTTRAGKYFNTVLYTGTGSDPLAVTGVGFQPDFTWIKARSAAYSHGVNDAVRGAGKTLVTNATDSEYNYGIYFKSFDSDGFTVGQASQLFNTNGTTYAAWNWKANGAGSSNTAGSITSTVSANTTAGFSIVTATKSAGASVAQTFGHGLGVAPAMIILKRRNGTEVWYVYHQSLGNNSRLQLNETAAVTSPTGVWDATSPTSTVFTVRSFVDGDFVAYCFAEVAGYSRFGSYTGNGSADGPMIFTGFRPAFVMVKRSSISGEGWWIYDNKRDTFNITDNILEANSSGAEISGGTYPIDMISNGFKIRGLNALVNTSGETYVFAAFAEVPLKYALAR